MAGSIEAIEPTVARGAARHPRHADYRMTVHALVRGRLAATAIAALAPVAAGHGFEIRFAQPVDPRHVRIVLGETDEDLTPAVPAERRDRMSVEDLIAAPTRRPWVGDACYIDGERAGLLPETIFDLLCRDYLGRAARRAEIAAELRKLQEGGGYDAIRRRLIGSAEFLERRIYADALPGAIFSQRAVIAAAAGDFAAATRHAGRVTTVSALKLLDLDGDAFLTACYRQILRKEPDREGLAYHAHQLASGRSRVDIIRQFANEFDAVSAGIHVIDLPAWA